MSASRANVSFIFMPVIITGSATNVDRTGRHQKGDSQKCATGAKEWGSGEKNWYFTPIEPSRLMYIPTNQPALKTGATY